VCTYIYLNFSCLCKLKLYVIIIYAFTFTLHYWMELYACSFCISLLMILAFSIICVYTCVGANLMPTFPQVQKCLILFKQLMGTFVTTLTYTVHNYIYPCAHMYIIACTCIPMPDYVYFTETNVMDLTCPPNVSCHNTSW